MTFTLFRALSSHFFTFNFEYDSASYAINASYLLASVVSSKMDFSELPCNDFYKFACGRFEKTSIMPEDSGSVNTINMIEGRVMMQLHTLLNSEIQPHEIHPFKMAKLMYRQCMNTSKHRRQSHEIPIVLIKKLILAQIEKNGLEFVKQKLNLTVLWPVLMNEDEWDESLWNVTDFYRFSVDFFIDTDLKNTSRRALYVSFPPYCNKPFKINLYTRFR